MILVCREAGSLDEVIPTMRSPRQNGFLIGKIFNKKQSVWVGYKWMCKRNVCYPDDPSIVSYRFRLDPVKQIRASSNMQAHEVEAGILVSDSIISVY
jgi:hypothetical protein